MNNQSHLDIRCEWGENGVLQLAPVSDIVIIVDVLSFCTSVDIATSRGASVYPCRWRDERAVALAASLGAELAGSRRADPGYSLSPQSLTRIPLGTRLVLPSPNGSTLTLATGTTPTLAGCLRNASAVALAAQSYGSRIAIIPAGERWADGSLRPALEDWLGAGAIIRHLARGLSPEAGAALAAFHQAEPDIGNIIRRTASGQELIQRGLAADVSLASALDLSECAPLLMNGAYVGSGL